MGVNGPETKSEVLWGLAPSFPRYALSALSSHLYADQLGVVRAVTRTIRGSQLGASLVTDRGTVAASSKRALSIALADYQITLVVDALVGPESAAWATKRLQGALDLPEPETTPFRSSLGTAWTKSHDERVRKLLLESGFIAISSPRWFEEALRATLADVRGEAHALGLLVRCGIVKALWPVEGLAPVGTVPLEETPNVLTVLDNASSQFGIGPDAREWAMQVWHRAARPSVKLPGTRPRGKSSPKDTVPEAPERPPAPKPPPARTVFERALEAQLANDLETAFRLFREVPPTDPNYAKAAAAMRAIRPRIDDLASRELSPIHTLATEAHYKGDLVSAHQLYREVPSTDPKHATALDAIKRIELEWSRTGQENVSPDQAGGPPPAEPSPDQSHSLEHNAPGETEDLRLVALPNLARNPGAAAALTILTFGYGYVGYWFWATWRELVKDLPQNTRPVSHGLLSIVPIVNWHRAYEQFSLINQARVRRGLPVKIPAIVYSLLFAVFTGLMASDRLLFELIGLAACGVYVYLGQSSMNALSSPESDASVPVRVSAGQKACIFMAACFWVYVMAFQFALP